MKSEEEIRKRLIEVKEAFALLQEIGTDGAQEELSVWIDALDWVLEE